MCNLSEGLINECTEKGARDKEIELIPKMFKKGMTICDICEITSMPRDRVKDILRSEGLIN